MTDHENIYAAMASALADLHVVEKGRRAKIKTKNGPDYQYDYADIGDVVKLTRPKLAEHGLVALTPIHDHGNGLACTVTILHKSGERLDFGPFPFDAGRDAQSTGSAVTYHRRYALVAALGMAAGDDDDGAHATSSAREPIEDAEPTVTSAEASRQLDAALKDSGSWFSGMEAKQLAEHAAEVWGDVSPKVVGHGRIPQSEVDRLLAAARKHADDVIADEAMRPNQ